MTDSVQCSSDYGIEDCRDIGLDFDIVKENQEVSIRIEYKNGRAILWFLLFWLVHGYRATNFMYGHDSLIIWQNDQLSQVSIGRWFQLILVNLRGDISSVWINTIIGALFLTLAIEEILRFFKTRNILEDLVIAAVMICNTTVAAISANYIYLLDYFMLSLFLSVVGTCLIYNQESKLKLVCGVIAIWVSLSIYQPFLSVSIVMVLFKTIIAFANGKDNKEVIKSGVSYLIYVLLSGLFYLVSYKAAMHLLHVTESSGYNSLAATDLSMSGMINNFKAAYISFVRYYVKPHYFSNTVLKNIVGIQLMPLIIKFANVLLLLFTLIDLARKNIQNNIPIKIKLMEAVGVIIAPLAANTACFFSGGVPDHDVMHYAMGMIYVLPVLLFFDCDFYGRKSLRTAKVSSKVICLLLLIIVWNNFIYINQVYVKKSLQDKATLSYATRLIDRIEQTDGYVSGETEVVIFGTVEESKYFGQISGFQDVTMTGLATSEITYQGTEIYYFRTVLNIPMSLSRSDDEIFENMDEFPSTNSVQYIDSRIYVKLSS